MIANDHQRATVSRRLGELKEWKERVLQETAPTPFQTEIEAAGIQKMIDRLQDEVDAYDSARSGNVPPAATAQVRDGSFAEVARMLVRLRVARGMRQEDLARALGKSQPSIARWEAEDYDGYTLKELSRLAQALGYQLQLTLVAPDTLEDP